MEALFLFAEKFSPKLDQENLRIIQCKIELEQARRNGNWIQIILGQGSFVDRLRAISVSNKFMFELRRIFYGLLSGW